MAAPVQFRQNGLSLETTPEPQSKFSLLKYRPFLITEHLYNNMIYKPQGTPEEYTYK